ncbi:MAG: diacylglycerol/lipid kinase family protein, partial [Planctomycetota bacterium]
MVKRTAIIYNPISGRGKGKRLGSDLAVSLKKYGFDSSLHPTVVRGDARRIASDTALDGIDVIVAVGGDGTVSEIVSGLNGSDVPIAICPTGTANVVAHELGLPHAPAKIAEMINRGRTKRIDAGKVGDTMFIVAASAGVDAWVIRDLHNTRKGSITMATYTTPIMRALRSYRYPPISVEI